MSLHCLLIEGFEIFLLCLLIEVFKSVLQPDDVPAKEPLGIPSGSVEGSRVVVFMKKQIEDQPVSMELAIEACIEQSTSSTG